MWLAMREFVLLKDEGVRFVESGRGASHVVRESSASVAAGWETWGWNCVVPCWHT